MSSKRFALPAALILSSAVAATVHASVTYTLTGVSPTGTGYQSTTATPAETSTYKSANVSGQVVYTTREYVGTVAAGTSAFIYTPGAGYTKIGLYDSGHSTTATSGTTTYANYNEVVLLGGLNASGQAAGTATAYSGTTNIGSDAWFYNGAISSRVGLFDAAGATTTQYTDGYVAGYHSTSVTAIGDSGVVGGYTTRYSAADTGQSGDGRDAWISINGAAAVQVGYTTTATDGVSYSYIDSRSMVNRSSLVSAINASGVVIGYSSRYTSAGSSLGQDAWSYNSATTAYTQLGYTGTGYTNSSTLSRSSTAVAITASGVIAGTSARYSGSTTAGTDSWIYNPSATTGTGYTNISLLGSTATAGYSYESASAGHISTVAYLSSSGKAAGTATIYNSGGSATGQDAFYYNGTTTTAIVPTSDASNSFRYGTAANRTSYVSAINASGEVAGYSYVYNSSSSYVGQDAWVYADGTTYTINLDTSITGSTSSVITYLSDAGIAVGYYTTYDPSTGNSLGSRAFVWSNGIATALSATVDTSTVNWTTLANAWYVTGNGTIIGSGNPAGYNGASLAIFSATTNAVPEPASLGLLAIGSVFFLRRRSV